MGESSGLQFSKLKHWRAFPDTNGWKGASNGDLRSIGEIDRLASGMCVTLVAYHLSYHP
jgi:hypothetical protein